MGFRREDPQRRVGLALGSKELAWVLGWNLRFVEDFWLSDGCRLEKL